MSFISEKADFQNITPVLTILYQKNTCKTLVFSAGLNTNLVVIHARNDPWNKQNCTQQAPGRLLLENVHITSCEKKIPKLNSKSA